MSEWWLSQPLTRRLRSPVGHAVCIERSFGHRRVRQLGLEIIASCWSTVLGTELVPLLGSESCPLSPCTIGYPNFGLGARTDRGEMGLPVQAEAKPRIGEQELSPPLRIVAAFSLVGWKSPQKTPKSNLLGADK